MISYLERGHLFSLSSFFVSKEKKFDLEGKFVSHYIFFFFKKGFFATVKKFFWCKIIMKEIFFSECTHTYDLDKI